MSPLEKKIKTVFWLLIFSSSLLFFTFKEELQRKYQDYIAPDIHFSIVDNTKKMNIKFTHKNFKVHHSLKNIEPWLSGIGASVAITDFNKDGFKDILFNTSNRDSNHHLYINNKNGTFSEASETTGLSKIKTPYPVTGTLFFDCNSDGFEDLLLLSYCPYLLENVGGKTFRNITKESGIECEPESIHARNLIDFNSDGRQDLIIAGYFDTNYISHPKTMTFMPGNHLSSSNESKIHLYESLGSCKFKKTFEKIENDDRGWNLAIGVYDFNGDNKNDIWIAKDFGNDKLLLNSGDGFKNLSENIYTSTSSRNGMNSEIADFDNDGFAEIYVSHILQKNEKVSGNLLWKQTGETQFKEISRSVNAHNCGWSWGAKFIDLDNNGQLDLAVANGFISADPEKRNYWYQLSVLGSGYNEAFKDAGKWPDLSDQTIAGYQRDCLFYFHDGRFHNMSRKVGYDNEKLDGRAVAYADFMNTGTQSLVVANQNGPAKIYTIEQKNENKWIGINSIDKDGNPALGTKLELNLKSGLKLNRVVSPLNGFSSQSDPRVIFGFGNGEIDHLKITWQDGSVQEIKSDKLKTHKYNKFTEPSHAF